MRTTASRSAREANRQPMSTGVPGPARASTRSARPRPGRPRGSRGGTSAEGRPGRVVVDDERRAATAYDAVELGQAGLAAGAEEVGPPRVHDVDRRVGQRQRLGGALRARATLAAGACGDGPARPGRGAARRRPPCAAVGGEPGQVEAGAAAEVEHVAAGPVGRSPASPTRSGRRGRRRGSRSRTSRGGARCWGWDGARGDRSATVRSRTSPCGVWTCAARMPGVPFGATHSTLTSSSGASTVSPSHSLTRCGSPAISRQASE